MKRVLPGTFYYVVCVLLLSTVTCLANNNLSSAHKTLPNRPFSNNLIFSITAPGDVVVQTDPYANTATNVNLGTPSFAKVTGVTYNISNNAPASFVIGITKVTWTVSDNAGNTATALQNVTVLDTEKPYVEHMGEISVVNDPGKCGAVVGLFTPFTYDNSGLPVTLTNDAPAYFSVGSTLIIWTATDAYGNSDTSSQLITVIDNELPVIKVTNISVFNDAGKCGAAVNLGTPQTSDNCGVASVTNDAPAFFPVGTTLVNWIVTDNTGYTSSAVQTIIVTDNEQPVFTSVPASILLKNSAGKCGAFSQLLSAPVATDNCGIVSIKNNAPALLPKGTTVVTWTATDLNGNTAAITQSVLVQDSEAPVFTAVPADVTVTCTTIPAVVNPVVTDNCDALPTVSFSQVSTKSANTNLIGYYNYTITRTWVAKDITGNTATAKQTITVTDKTAPSLTVPSNITVSNDQNKCGAVVRYAASSASDNCSSPVTISYSISSGSLFPVGSTTVTVTAKDLSGNTTTKTFIVKVNDTQNPFITAPADLSLTVGSITSVLSNVNLGTPVSSDNCGVKSVTNNAPVSFAAGTTRVTWTVTDNSGNTSSSIQKVIVSVSMGGIVLKKTNELSNDITTFTNTTAAKEPADELKISTAPNPSIGYFTLMIHGRSGIPVSLKITDITGRVVEARSKLTVNSSIQVGGNYLPGIYFAEMTQGAQHSIIQLIKVK